MDPSIRRKTESHRRSTCATIEHAKALSSQAARHAAGGQTHEIGAGARDADDDTIADERHQQPDALDHELPAGAEEERVQAQAPRLAGSFRAPSPGMIPLGTSNDYSTTWLAADAANDTGGTVVSVDTANTYEAGENLCPRRTESP